jgi:hypothetical protein
MSTKPKSAHRLLWLATLLVLIACGVVAWVKWAGARASVVNVLFQTVLVQLHLVDPEPPAPETPAIPLALAPRFAPAEPDATKAPLEPSGDPYAVEKEIYAALSEKMARVDHEEGFGYSLGAKRRYRQKAVARSIDEICKRFFITEEDVHRIYDKGLDRGWPTTFP